MPKYRIEIVEETTRAVIVEVPEGTFKDDVIPGSFVDLVDEIAMETGRGGRRVEVARVDDSMRADVSYEGIVSD